MHIDALYAQRVREPSDIWEHLEYLHDQVCRFPGAVVVELGTRGGVSTAALLAAVEKVGGVLTAVDIKPGKLPFTISAHPQFRLLEGDDIELSDQIPECDVLFVDTSHHYGHTLAELAAYMPKVRRLAMFHDTSVAEPEYAPAADPPFPVARALDEWCAANGQTWTNRDWCNGLGTIEVQP
jgi:cephalosporin hydroxylase